MPDSSYCDPLAGLAPSKIVLLWAPEGKSKGQYKNPPQNINAETSPHLKLLLNLRNVGAAERGHGGKKLDVEVAVIQLVGFEVILPENSASSQH